MKPVWSLTLFSLLLAMASGLQAADTPKPSTKPNIVFILADDLGYGDVQVLNPQSGKIKTPHLDRLAAQGMTFTDAHSGSSVCTPTRYGLLTGRYAWRTRLQSGVLGGFSPPLIEVGRLTVPALLKQHGYTTACIGKWHLGMSWPSKGDGRFGDEILGDAKDGAAMNSVDWTKPIQNSPTTRGFDSFFGISASLDMPPFVSIRNNRVTEVPTSEKKWLRSGPAGATFEAVEALPALAAEASAQIKSRAAGAKAGTPFFLYLALTSPHTPVLPSKEWQGRSGLGDYADFVMQTDAAVGAVLATIDAHGLASNTLVIFTSDNGFAPQADPKGLLREQGHKPSAEFRGYKSDIWDGGHRVPFLVRWPARIMPQSSSPQLICLTDFLATCADILGVKLPDDAGEDSVSILPALLGQDNAPLREAVVHHSIDGRFAIRKDNWKLELCTGSGGWGNPSDAQAKQAGLPDFQLYDLSVDIGETKNLLGEQPEVVRRLTALLEKYVADGRSTSGTIQTNDVKLVPIQSQSKASKE
jgi:arylsulfatase A